MQRDELVSRFIDTSHTVQRAWKAYFYRLMIEEDLSPAQMGILFLLKRKQPVSGSDIADELHISRSAVTQVVDALERQDYVSREDSRQDRRVSYLCLSDKGFKKVRQLESKRHKMLESVAESLSDEELEALAGIHAKMLKILEK